MIKVAQTNDTRLLTLSVTTEDKNTSRDLANDVAAFACDYFNLRHNASIANVVDKAVAPQNPSNPVSLVTVLLIAFVCAFAVYAIYLVIFIMDDKINNEDDVQRVLGMNVLGVIPDGEKVAKSKSKRYAAYASYNTDIAN
jgi:capsular polysaccharide biosynthesis protein